MGNPVLRRRTPPLDPAEIGSPAIQRLIDDMFETMREYAGIGLAAPQVHEDLRLFVAGVEDPDAGLPPIVMINPGDRAPRHDRRGGLGRVPQHPGHPGTGAALHRHPRPRARPARRAAADDRAGFRRAGHPARDGPPRRRPLLRPHGARSTASPSCTSTSASGTSRTPRPADRQPEPAAGGPPAAARRRALRRSASRRSSATSLWSTKLIASAIARWPACSAMSRCIRWQTRR